LCLRFFCFPSDFPAIDFFSFFLLLVTTAAALFIHPWQLRQVLQKKKKKEKKEKKERKKERKRKKKLSCMIQALCSNLK